MQRNNLPIIIGVVLILLLILVIVGVTVIPKMLYHPNYSFVYTYGNDSYYQYYPYTSYYVANQKIVQETKQPDPETQDLIKPLPEEQGPYEERLYLYDVKSGSSREITELFASEIYWKSTHAEIST